MTLHRVSDTVTDEFGNWVEGAQVVLWRDGAVAPMFADEAGAVPIAQAVTGADGRYTFWAAFGAYRVEATVRGVTRGVDGVWVGASPQPDAAEATFEDYIRAQAHAGLSAEQVGTAGMTVAPLKSGKSTVLQTGSAPHALLLPKAAALGWTHTVVQDGAWPVLVDLEPGATGRSLDGPLPVQLRGDGDMASVMCVGNNPGLTAAEFVLVLVGN